MSPFPVTTSDLWRQSNEHFGDLRGTSGSAVETGNTCLTVESGKPEVDTTKEIHMWYLLLVVIPIFTVFGNVLICLSVWREATLQTVTNYFIVSLAIADIMVAILVMPLAIYVQVNDSIWQLGDALCDTWVAFDVMCCTASILNLTAISIDRFIAVTQPLRYARHKNSKRVYITLASTWVVSIAVSLPIAVGWNYTERRSETPWLCTFYNADFLIYSSMTSFYIPCLLMTLLYYKTFKAILRQAERKRLLKKEKEMVTHQKKKEMVGQAVAGRSTRGVKVKGLPGQGRRPSRVSGPTQSTTDSEMSENSGSGCSTLEERVPRSTLLRVLPAAWEETRKDSTVGDLEGSLDAVECRCECGDDGGIRSDTLKDDGSKNEMKEFACHSIGRQSEKLWLNEKRNAIIDSTNLSEAERKTEPNNGVGSDAMGSCAMVDHKKHVSCSKQNAADSSNAGRSPAEQEPDDKDGNVDSHENKESVEPTSPSIQDLRVYCGHFQPTVGNNSGIDKLSRTKFHEIEDGRKNEETYNELNNCGGRTNHLPCNRQAGLHGDGKERQSLDSADSTELLRRWETTRNRFFSTWNNRKQTTLSFFGDESVNTTSLTREFLRDTIIFSSHRRQNSSNASKVLKERSSFGGNEIKRENGELTRELQPLFSGGSTNSIRPVSDRKRSRETWPAGTEGRMEKEEEPNTAEVSTGIITSPGSTSLNSNVEFTSTESCQMEVRPSTWPVRKETSLPTTCEPRIVFPVRKEDEQDGSNALPISSFREDYGHNRDRLTVERERPRQYFVRDDLTKSFDLSDNTGQIRTSRLTGSTGSLQSWQNACKDSNRLEDSGESEIFHSRYSSEISPIPYNQLNTHSKEGVREVPITCPDYSSTREVPRTCGGVSRTKDERTAGSESNTGNNDVLGSCAASRNVSEFPPQCQSTFSNDRLFHEALNGSKSPPEPTMHGPCHHSCESRSLVARNSLTGERVRPRDYSSCYHHHHLGPPPTQHSISVPGREEEETPKAGCCRRGHAVSTGRHGVGRGTKGPLLTVRQRDALLLSVRVDGGRQVVRTQLASGREKREKVFTKRERKATTTLAIVLGVFLLCWVPFFTLNIVNAVCIRYSLFASSACSIHQVAFDFFVWLGYFNSFLNPVIYTIFNVEFRKAFKRFFVEPCR